MSGPSAFYRPRHAVILAHPGTRSFNGLVADAYCEAVRQAGQEAIVRNLYAEGFDPVLKDSERPHEGGTALSADVRFERDAIRDSDVLVFVYPIWFGMPPAILKGYVDRVLGAGVTVRAVQDGDGTALLAGKRLLSITSSGASKAWLNQQHQIDALHILFEDYLANAFGMIACDGVHFGETVEGLAEAYIDPLLARVGDLAQKICADVAVDRATAARSDQADDRAHP